MAAKKKKSRTNQKASAEQKPARSKSVRKQTASKPAKLKSADKGDNKPQGKSKPQPQGKSKPQAKSKKNTKARASESKSESKLAPFPIVGLGASAGGLEALEEFFHAMPTETGMGFVVVMHQAAKHVSLLPELLAKCTGMQVAPIHEGTVVQPNCVYIVPPGKNVDMLGGILHLTEIPPKHGVSLPIDHFFRSLAEDRKERSVAIVLSGTGTDGTVGLSAIKGESGMVMVQSVESAKFDGMPQHAIEAGWADYVLAPPEMPEALVAYARGPFLKSPRAVDKPAPAIKDSLPEIMLGLRRRCGHDFSGYKPTTICRRIERRMNVHQIVEPKQYLRYLGEHEAESELLFKDLLIGVTSFFRDPEAFESLTKMAIMPILKSKTQDSTVRVWVPGCATGEEAYSIAIILRECMDELKIHLTVQIFATDLDANAIETARSGFFASGIASDVSAGRLSQCFTKHESSYRIRKELRDWIVFAPQNVIHDPPFTKLDLVSCRNLLIYLQGDLQNKLLTLFHYSLVPGGVLFLGTSESIGGFGDLFEVIDNKAKIFACKESKPHSKRVVEFPITAAPSKSKQVLAMATPPKSHFSNSAVSELLVNCFAPPTVIVNSEGGIVHVHGRTGAFLELAEGGAPKDIVMMARHGLESDLSTALRTAERQTGPVVHRNIPVKTNGNTELVDLTVEQITFPDALAGLFRISFQVAALAPPVPEKSAKGKKTTQKKSNRQNELERELQHTRESLQRSIEELDASNEEMKSTNEELQSTNEELQSTNEELETSKEELQSLNEELQTVNAEFQDKIHDLSRANDDMTNLLNATDIATVFLDNQLCIKRYTEQAQKIIRMIPTDIGRPLGDLTSSLEHHDLVADCRQVLKSLVFIETEVCTADGRWLLVRILPYRTSADRIDGLVMTFIDINELKQIQQEIEFARDFADNIVATVRAPMLVLDGKFRLQLASEAFCKMFQITAKSAIGQSIYELGKGQWNLPPLRKLLETVLPQNSRFDDFEVQYQFPDGDPVTMSLYGRRIIGGGETADLILLGIEEKAE